MFIHKLLFLLFFFFCTTAYNFTSDAEKRLYNGIQFHLWRRKKVVIRPRINVTYWSRCIRLAMSGNSFQTCSPPPLYTWCPIPVQPLGWSSTLLWGEWLGWSCRGLLSRFRKSMTKIKFYRDCLLLSVPARVNLLSAGYLTSAELAVRLSNSMKIWNKVTPIIQVLKLSLFYVLSNDRVVIGIVMHVNGFKNDTGPCTD